MKENNIKYSGLNDNEVLKSREKYGANVLTFKKRDSFLIKVLKTIKEPMFMLLLIAASVYFIVGEFIDGLIMLISVLIICTIEFFEEQKTDKAIEELNKLTSLNIKVIRNSRQVIIDSKEIVVGDIVFLEEGDKVPADGIILECQGFATDESQLTGESKVIYKSNKEDNENHYKTNYCYEGSIVTNGTAIIKITAVGKNTEFGKIGEKLTSIKKEVTPLEKQINKFVLVCTSLSIVLFILVIIINFINYSDLAIKSRIVESVLSGITIAMAMIPEEIPVVLTVFLSLGALKLSKQNTLTRNNKTIETLSAMTVLCTDKTGTLTENRMVVEDTYNYCPDILKIAYLACEKSPYDPMEIAIKEYYHNNYDDVLENNKRNLIHEYIFNSEDKMVGKVWQENNQNNLCVKGAYEKILSLCNLDIKEKNKIKNQANKYANEGYRVLAVAKCENIKEILNSINDYTMEFCGLIALSDPPREGVKESIHKCITAGIRVIMITGDSGDTALGIAKKLDIKNCDKYLTGEELEKMSDAELIEKVKYINIYARVYPEHKMRIVTALQKNGEVVGMTGDGINDAPALKKADIGIAMGSRGTNVAKEASDIILLDDNFNTIVNSIENGRCIYKNIRKSISYILTIHIPIALLSLIVPLLGLPNLLLPVHIVLLELLLDPTSSIIFQRIEPDKNIMLQKPRKKNESIITLKGIIKCILQGLSIFLVVILTYNYMIKNNYSISLSSTVSYTILLLSIMLIAFNLKNDNLTLTNLVLSFKDKTVILINGIIITILMLFVYLPFSHITFKTCNLNINNWILIILLTFLAVLPFDILKIKIRRNYK